jgi:hypothetical protein
MANADDECAGRAGEHVHETSSTAGRILDAWRAFLRCERRTWLRIFGRG